MPWQPKPAGPRNLREMFHWVYRQLQDVGNAIPVTLDTDIVDPANGDVLVWRSSGELSTVGKWVNTAVNNGYGGLFHRDSGEAFEINATTPVVIEGFDAVSPELVGPSLVDVSLVDRTITITRSGVWQIHFYCTVEHAANLQILLRLYQNDAPTWAGVGVDASNQTTTSSLNLSALGYFVAGTKFDIRATCGAGTSTMTMLGSEFFLASHSLV